MSAISLIVGTIALGLGWYLLRQRERDQRTIAELAEMVEFAGEIATAAALYAARNEPRSIEIVEADLFGLTEV